MKPTMNINIERYLNVLLAKGKTYEQAVSETKRKLDWLEEKTLAVRKLTSELRLYDEEMDMMKQRNRVRDKLNDPLKKVTRKTITSNFYKIVNAKEAQFMIDLCK